MPVVSFNTLLQQAGLDPSRVKLVRHQDTRTRYRRSIWDAWRTDRELFDSYQSFQRAGKLNGADQIASFIVSPSGRTIFVGIYKIRAQRALRRRKVDQLSGNELDPERHVVYELALTDKLAEGVGLVVVNWGPGKRAWVQRASRQDKPVVEILLSIEEDPFPGYREFRRHIDDLGQLPEHWIAPLRAVGGVYLLTNLATGRQYIGSAYGEAGLWGRWQSYLRTGHGGNVELRELGSTNFEVCILEIVSPAMPENEVIELESLWKEKLKTRQFGLNRN